MKKYLLCLVYLLSWQFSFSSEVLVLGNESMPFNGVEANKNVGVCVEILEEITKHGGPNFKYQLGLPWLRAQKMLHDSNSTSIAIIPFTKTPAREKNHTWITKLISHEIHLMTPNQEKSKMSLTSLKTERIGLRLGSAALPQLTDYGFNKIEQLTNSEIATKMLISNRISLYADSEVVAKYLWRKAGEKRKLYTGPKLGNTMDIYLAGNLRFSPQIAREINQAMDKMIANGKLNEILKKWDN